MVKFKKLTFEDYYLYHYACSDYTKKPIRISCISVFDPKTEKIISFSQPERKETAILRDFFKFVKGHPAIYISWASSNQYGIEILKDRYSRMVKKKVDPKRATFTTFIDILKEEYGSKKLVTLPRIKHLAILNTLEMEDYLEGEVEATKYGRDYTGILKSCETKTQLIYGIVSLAISNQLILNNSIKKITIKNLFKRDEFNYTIDFENYNEPLVILHGKNGSGKTTILKLINSFLKYEIFDIDSNLFNEVCIEFKNGDICSISSGEEGKLSLNLNNNLITTYFDDPRLIRLLQEPKILRSLSSKDRYITQRNIRNILAHRKMSHREERELITIYERLAGYGSINTLEYSFGDVGDSQTNMKREINRLKNTLNSIQSFFVETNRLQRSILTLDEERQTVRKKGKSGSKLQDNPLEILQDDLSKQYDDVIDSFAGKSQILDSTFVYRLIEETKSIQDYKKTSEELVDELSRLNEKRVELINFSLLKDDPYPFQKIEKIENHLLHVINMFINDRKEKYGEFEDLANKAKLFIEFSNNHIEGKIAKISESNKIIFETDDDDPISLSLDQLSSGEKHIILFAYYLIFFIPKGSLVLIDEPEISLHVTWQRSFLKDILKIGKISDLQFIIATHSPDIAMLFEDNMISLKVSGND